MLEHQDLKAYRELGEKLQIFYVRFEDFTAVAVKNAFF
jgi:hypothetical protein